MNERLRMLVLAVSVSAAALSLGGCETNTATGRQIFTMGSSIEDDQKIGAQEHPKIIQEFGGVYDDPNVTSYVAIIGARMAAASEFANIPWRFTVLNSEDCWRLPPTKPRSRAFSRTRSAMSPRGIPPNAKAMRRSPA